MYTNSKLSKAVRLALAFGAVSAAGFTASAIAAEEDEVAKVERIEVTGSRIKRIDIEPTRPVTMISSDYISQRGIANAQDAVTDIPGVFAAASPEIGGNTQAASQGLGQRTINIYGLGSQRTLTLVNGSRFVSSNSPVGGASAAGSQMDVSNIPVALIDRVEVVKVGGAAVYGADAVAGVVNYILKKDYEGAEFSLDNKAVGGDLGDDFSLRGLAGGNFAAGRGNAVISVEYNKVDNILARDVKSLANNWSSFTPVGDDRVLDSEGKFPANQVRLYPNTRAGILSFSGLITPGPSAITNLGIGAWGDGNFYQFNPAGDGSMVAYDPGSRTGNAVWSAGGDGLDLGATNTATEGYERWNFTSILNYKINDYVNLATTIFSTSSNAVNPGYQALQYNSGVFGGLSSALQFDTSYPFLREDARNQIEDLIGGPGQFYIHRGWVNLGQREVTNESSTHSVKFAFDGEFEIGDKYWNWETYYQKGWSSVFSQSSGLNPYKFLAAMDVGINPNTNAIDCRFNYEAGYGENLRARGLGVESTELPIGNPGDCVALDPFGEVSEGALNYVLYNTMGKTRIEQEIYSAYLSGDVFELPAGALSAAFGYEYRKEFASYADDGTSSLTGFSDNSVTGSYDTSDLYTEFYIPVLSSDMDVPFMHSLSFETSYRTMDNSRSGRDDAWALGMNFRPIEDVMIRANVQRTVRAPAVTELFLPRVESSQFASDPCDARFRGNGPNPAQRNANCNAEGIPEDFNSIAANASRRGFNGGNLELGNEVSKSKNIGIIYNPSWIDGFAIGVDYVEIDISDAIVSFTLNNIMAACYDATDFPNKFCGQFTRGADYQLPTTNAFESGYVNAALRSFRAIEYNVSYTTAVNDIPGLGSLFSGSDAGRLDVSARFFNQKKNATSNTGFDFTDTTGQHDNPDWRSDFRIKHEIGNLSTLLDITYEGEGKRNVFQTNPIQYIDQNGTPYTEIASRTLVNFGVNYQLFDNTVIRARVENLTDWEPDAKENAVGRWTYGRSYNFGFTTTF